MDNLETGELKPKNKNTFLTNSLRRFGWDISESADGVGSDFFTFRKIIHLSTGHGVVGVLSIEWLKTLETHK